MRDAGLRPVSGDDPAQVWIRGDNLFSGYWPDGVDGPDDDGWYATGDLGVIARGGDLILVDRLRELGYPVEAAPGNDGGYRLAAGAHLPPLVLDDEEAGAIAVGLLSGRWLQIVLPFGILYSLAVWSTAEAFGGPYTLAGTGVRGNVIGNVVVYVIVFLFLWAWRRARLRCPPSRPGRRCAASHPSHSRDAG